MMRALHAAALTTLATLTALACGDDDTVGAGTADAAADDAGPLDGPADTSPPPLPGDSSLPPVDATLVLRTSASRGELPEGIAYRGGETFLGYAATGKIVRVSATGTRSNYAQVPVSTTSVSRNFLLGLAFDTDGNLYAGLSSANPPDPAAPAGIYKVPAGGTDGGVVSVFATAATMQFPNGLAFDPAGRLLVSDSGGRIFLVPRSGGPDSASVFLDHALLAGDNAACPLPAQPFTIGANGLVIDAAGSAMYIANTNKGSVVRVPLADAGTPVPTLLAQDCAMLEGADGLAFDSRESSVLVTTAQNTVVRVGLAGGALSTVYAGLPLDFPASIVRIPGSSSPEVYHLTNAAFLTSAMVDAGFHPQPGLVRLTVR